MKPFVVGSLGSLLSDSRRFRKIMRGQQPAEKEPYLSGGIDPADGVQPMIDALGGAGTVMLPKGTFYGNPNAPLTPINVPGGVEIIGAGMAATVLGSPVLVNASQAGLGNLAVRPNGTAYGIRIYNGGSPFISRCFMRRVLTGASFKGAGDGPVDGIQLDGAGVLLMEHVTCAFCTGHGLIADSTGFEPNTTILGDCCSFVQNGLYGARLLQSLTLAEFNGGNMEDNQSGELYAENAAGISLLGVDFERGALALSLTAAVVEMQNCNTIEIDRCNFLRVSNATRAWNLAGCNGIKIGVNRFEGWGAVGVWRIAESSRNADVGAGHIFNGSGWTEDYSR
jgi:hypothetical protein